MKSVLHITPNRRWLDFRWRELWEARELIFRFVHRDFISSYKQTILGPLWFIVPPVVTTIVFSVVFGDIAKIPTNGIPNFLFFMSGVILWNYFSTCLLRTSNTFSGNSGIFGKVYFPRLTVPISILITNLLNLLIQICIFFAAYLWFLWRGKIVAPSAWILLLPVLLFLLATLALGIGGFVSALTTRYRDLGMVVGFGVQLWMYASCIVYPFSEVPEKWKWLVALNPIVPIIETWRSACFSHSGPEWSYLGMSAGITAVMCFSGLLIFKRMETTFMDTV